MIDDFKAILAKEERADTEHVEVSFCFYSTKRKHFSFHSYGSVMPLCSKLSFVFAKQSFGSSYIA